MCSGASNPEPSRRGPKLGRRRLFQGAVAAGGLAAAGAGGLQIAQAQESHPGRDRQGEFRWKHRSFYGYQAANADQFLNNHNDACITNYWSNWDLCTLASVLAIGVFNEDDGLVDRAIDYMYHGEGNGSIEHAIPFVHQDEGLAQQQESGRDQGHTLMDTGLLGTICEMAWTQGVDLYGHSDNRVAKCADYVARYNLGLDVPFTTYAWGHWQTCAPREQTIVSEASRGQVRPVWNVIYHHYAGRQGWRCPSRTRTPRTAPKAGDYGDASGGYDALGFGTLTYTR
ncbi:MAG TPA: alginate lyase family protein [Glycomyces sp.]|nr:alginate lyase family protein [Glycomyces sp.]